VDIFNIERKVVLKQEETPAKWKYLKTLSCNTNSTKVAEFFLYSWNIPYQWV